MNVKTAVNGESEGQIQAETQDENIIVTNVDDGERVENVDETVSGSQDEAGQEAANDDDEVVVSIGEESPPQEEKEPAPEWVRELRKSYRELQREKRELEARLTTSQKAEEKPLSLGAKPTLEQFDYDAEQFEGALEQWYENKRKVQEQDNAKKAEQQKAEQDWQNTLKNYGSLKSQLKVKDYDDAEHVVLESLNETKQGIILHGAKNPALVVYALGKNPQKVKELASIDDPVKFAIAIGGLEKELKVTSRKTASPPPPESKVRGSAPISGAVDSTLERLREEAARSGDHSKVFAYKQQLKRKS
ncbi:MAG: hypothetical protein IM336_01690 [Microcystis sp. M018S1]|uniref:hypothetical protein n=1 Tax=Microcystis sp. M018S1 TaxID=2771108 RepID=UPI00258B19EB|nr:hypothetical protein [Microcystis sp. M018S1]MCA2929273.1 hypothetical protein [Microcystis sp. M018S1]MCA3171125.1 hypothetical protein [Burkholderiales bacterium]